MAHAVSGFVVASASTSSPRSVDFERLREALRELVPTTLRKSAQTVSLAGELRQPGALSDIAAFLAQSGRSGTLVVASADGVRSLTTEGGDLASASSTIASERIGELLQRIADVSPDELDEASVIAAIDGRRVGDVLVSEGRVEAAALESIAHKQAEQIFYAALAVDTGVFCFVEAAERESRTTLVACGSCPRASLMSLLMEGARRCDEMVVMREKVVSSRMLPTRRHGHGHGHGRDADTSSLTPELTRLLSLCDGMHNVDELGRAVGLMEYEATEAIFRLAKASLIDLVEPPDHGCIEEALESATRLRVVEPVASAVAAMSATPVTSARSRHRRRARHAS